MLKTHAGNQHPQSGTDLGSKSHAQELNREPDRASTPLGASDRPPLNVAVSGPLTLLATPTAGEARHLLCRASSRASTAQHRTTPGTGAAVTDNEHEGGHGLSPSVLDDMRASLVEC